MKPAKSCDKKTGANISFHNDTLDDFSDVSCKFRSHKRRNTKPKEPDSSKTNPAVSFSRNSRNANQVNNNPGASNSKLPNSLRLHDQNKNDSSVNLLCPICFKPQSSLSLKLSHLKKCGNEHNFSPETVIEAMRNQKQNACTIMQSYEKAPRRKISKKKDTPIENEDVELAMALSLSMCENANKELIEQEQEIMELGVPGIIEEQRKLRKAVAIEPIQSMQVKIQKVSKKRQKRKIQKNTKLTRTTQEDRDRILSERVAHILVNEEVCVPKLSEIVFQNPLKKFVDQKSNLWKKSSTDCQLEDYYVGDLNEYIQPTELAVGGMLKHYSQVPGRLNFTRICQEETDDVDTSIIDGYSTQLYLAELLGSQDFPDTQDSFRAASPTNSETNDDSTKAIDNDVSSSKPLDISNPVSVKLFEKSQCDTPYGSLSKDWGAILSGGNYSDIIIKTKNDDIKVHSLVLHARCPNILSENCRDVIDLSLYNHACIMSFLTFIYTGVWCGRESDDVLLVAKKYECFELVNLINNSGREITDPPVSPEHENESMTPCEKHVSPSEKIEAMKAVCEQSVSPVVKNNVDESLVLENTAIETQLLPSAVKNVPMKTLDQPIKTRGAGKESSETVYYPSVSPMNDKGDITDCDQSVAPEFEICSSPDLFEEDHDNGSHFKTRYTMSPVVTLLAQDTKVDPKRKLSYELPEPEVIDLTQPEDLNSNVSSPKSPESFINPIWEDFDNIGSGVLDCPVTVPSPVVPDVSIGDDTLLDAAIRAENQEKPHMVNEHVNKHLVTPVSKFQNNQVTPMPPYQAMVTPELKKALEKYGLRKMSRNKAIKLLVHIYEEMHPLVTDSEASYCETPRSSKIVKGKGRLLLPKISKEPCYSENINISQSSTSSGDSINEMHEESYMHMETEDEITATQADNINGRIMEYIKSNDELHQKILLYEPIWFSELQESLKLAGIKCSHKKLLDFLDEQCITFRFDKEGRWRKQNKRKRSNSTSPNKGKRNKKGTPPKKSGRTKKTA